LNCQLYHSFGSDRSACIIYSYTNAVGIFRSGQQRQHSCIESPTKIPARTISAG
jgi:hypothetical protein